MKNCILCGSPTTGSVGAAGIKWSVICQPCKNEEDSILFHRIKSEARILSAIIEAADCQNDRAEYEAKEIKAMREVD